MLLIATPLVEGSIVPVADDLNVIDARGDTHCHNKQHRDDNHGDSPSREAIRI